MSKFIVLGLDGACPGIFEKAAADGLMPNLRRLKAMGCSGVNVPFPAAVTPGNWTSIATGARPMTIGISDFSMHTVGAPLNESHAVFSKDVNNRAEFLWDAYSERGHKAATIAYPGALPQTKPNHLAIGNYGMPAENADPYTIAPSRALVAGGLNPAGPYGWKEHERVEPCPARDDPGVEGFTPRSVVAFSVRGVNRGYSGEHAVCLYLGRRGGEPAGVIVCGKEKFVVRKGEWTPFIEREFTRDNAALQKWQLKPLQSDSVAGEFRMRITELDPDRGDLLLYVTAVYPKYCFSSDVEATRGLRDELGPYSDNLPISRLLMGWLDGEGFYDEFRLQGVWEARAALRLVNDMGYRAVFTKWHAFDKFYHFFMQKIDPVALNYDAAEFDRYEKLHNMLLSIADEMIGIVLSGLKDDTSLVVISDHGLMASRRAAWVNRYLAQHGYIRYSTDERGKPVIDWSRTRAYVSAFLILNVNLKGRDPQGIVEPGEQHENLKAELIELLRDWKDLQTGRHVMTDVFDPKKDGAFYGLGGVAAGDVRYFSAPGYSLYRSTSVVGGDVVTDIHGPYLGDHGSCRPTTRFGRGGEVGVFYAAGKGFRRGYERPAPVFPCDIMPTLLHVAREKPLRNQEGAVLQDVLSR